MAVDLMGAKKDSRAHKIRRNEVEKSTLKDTKIARVAVPAGKSPGPCLRGSSRKMEDQDLKIYHAGKGGF